ncbi:DUF4190 domain-containing protein [Agrococcus sp. ProA11]|uniref:DUF4190 domain-containing protein n=1 Tax=Agrococcus chionoecetis TaxID=3153752 RepID=UPI0032610F19
MSASGYPQQGWPTQPSAPATQPPAPTWSAPAWSAPTHPGPKTNLLAIIAIVAAAAGATIMLGIGSIAAIVLGFIALAQIRRTGDDGRVLAIWSVVLGIVTLVALIASVVLGVGAFLTVAEQATELTGP